VQVDSEVVPGPLFDFGLLMFHSGRALAKSRRGPFFYLPKLESALEAKLWDDIFTWTETRLAIPFGTYFAVTPSSGMSYLQNRVLYNKLRTFNDVN